MSNKSILMTDSLYDYLLANSLREPEALTELRQETAQHPYAGMQIAPEQGQFMNLLVKLTGATKILEIGVFTGYSSISLALALPPEGRLTACDISSEYTNIARRYWQKLNLSDKIDLHLAPALETLEKLIANQQSFDLAFIDADKTNYDAYYESVLKLLRPGGLLLIDNVLWNGQVADLSVNDADTLAIRKLNEKIYHDDRVSISLLPLADGLTLVLKR